MIPQAALLVATGAAVPPPASGAPRGPRLEYVQGPAACDVEDDFRAAVAAEVGGRDPFNAQARDVVRVRFEAVPGGFRSIVVYTDANGQDEAPIENADPDCRLLALLVAGTVASFVPPLPSPPPEPARVPAWAPPPLPPARFDDEPPLALRKKMDVTLLLRLAPVLTINWVPPVSPGGELGVGVRAGWFEARLDARVLFPAEVTATLPVPPNTTAIPHRLDVAQGGAVLGACGHYDWEHVGLFGCAEAFLGIITFARTGEVLIVDYQVNLGPRLGVTVPIVPDRFSLDAWGEVLIPTNPRGVKVYNDSAWGQADVSAFFGLGPVVHFK